MFENDVNQYGTQTEAQVRIVEIVFENDVNQYGTQTLIEKLERIAEIGTGVVELLADIFLGIEQGGILCCVLGIPLGLLLYRLDEIVGKKEDKQS